MAQRFGGKYSPDNPATGAPTTGAPAPGGYRGARPSLAGARVNLLFLAPLPLIFRSFGNGANVMALNLGALGLLLLAAWLTREGLIAQEAYEARKISRRPALPRKLAGALLTGLGLGLAGFTAGGGLVAALIYLVMGTALHVMAFGPDPLRDKGMDGVDMFETDRVARAVDKAEALLGAMREAVQRTGDRNVVDRVERFQTSVRDMLRTIENDPRDLTAARKYLTVYLTGARDATVKFADIHARSQDAGARSKYMMLLTDLEENFRAKTQKLLIDNNTDLDIEIEVLRDRLQREGVRLSDRENTE